MLSQKAWLGKAFLNLGSPVKTVSDESLTAALYSNPKVVVKFYSPGCPACRTFAPIYESLAAQYPDVLFADVNVDDDFQQATANQVQVIPTVVFFVNGQAVGRIDGVGSQADFVAQMNRAFSSATSQGNGSSSAAPSVLGGVALVAAIGAAAYFLLLD